MKNFPYSFEFRSSYKTELDFLQKNQKINDWCIENLGVENYTITWDFEKSTHSLEPSKYSAEKYTQMLWYFWNPDVAVEFALIWT